MARTGSPATRPLAAVERATAVLDALAAAGGELGTTELARRTGVNVSTVSRLLGTLAAAGYVEQVPETGRYRLGAHVLQLANAVLARLDVRTLARPVLERLVDAVGETATVSLPAGDEAVTVDFVPGRASVISVARVGRPSVAHATAVGKVMLAFSSSRSTLPDEPLTAYTTRTIVDPAALALEVERVRREGTARAVGERESDLNAVAAPVLDGRGALAAILGVQGPAARFDVTALDAAVPQLEAAARRLSQALGHGGR